MISRPGATPPQRPNPNGGRLRSGTVSKKSHYYQDIHGVPAPPGSGVPNGEDEDPTESTNHSSRNAFARHVERTISNGSENDINPTVVVNPKLRTRPSLFQKFARKISIGNLKDVPVTPAEPMPEPKLVPDSAQDAIPTIRDGMEARKDSMYQSKIYTAMAEDDQIGVHSYDLNNSPITLGSTNNFSNQNSTPATPKTPSRKFPFLGKKSEPEPLDTTPADPSARYAAALELLSQEDNKQVEEHEKKATLLTASDKAWKKQKANKKVQDKVRKKTRQAGKVTAEIELDFACKGRSKSEQDLADQYLATAPSNAETKNPAIKSIDQSWEFSNVYKAPKYGDKVSRRYTQAQTISELVSRLDKYG
jgi:hypothetical protein